MSVFGFFQPSVLGMGAQSHALNATASNIANMRTGGYKRTDVQFSTVLSKTLSSQPGMTGNAASGTSHSDFGGVRPNDHQRVSLQGLIETTERKLDAAIDGNGFFVLNTRPDGSGESLYGRDGRFSGTVSQGTGMSGGGAISIDRGYLVDKNGHYVQGWAANPNGSFPTGAASLTSLRIDPAAFADVGEPTRGAALALNLPATAAPGDRETFAIDIFDSTGVRRDLILHFDRDAIANSWGFNVFGAAGDAISITANGAPAPQVTFSPSGYIATPAAFDVGITHPGGTTSRFALDVGGLTQFGDTFSPFSFNRDGFAASPLQSVEFDSRGHVVGVFASGMAKPIYKLALAAFANADGLDARNGNVYAQSAFSGTAEVGAAGTNGLGRIIAAAHELSNVDLAQEFSHMIVTQNAYNASATSFRTADEMTEVARDLKR
jgi:flagellar hook protein FlgE